MAFLKLIIAIAITMAITITLIATNPPSHPEASQDTTTTPSITQTEILLPTKRVSRFLTENGKTRNPNAADHCHKDPDVCLNLPPELGGTPNATTCCNNKCVDLRFDDSNCGACKNKCKFSQVCCRGECVYLAYDKRHCGECNSPCRNGEFCVYGLCNYA